MIMIMQSDVETGIPAAHTKMRKDEVLTNKEKQFLLAVERGDLGSVKSYLDMAEVRQLQMYISLIAGN